MLSLLPLNLGLTNKMRRKHHIKLAKKLNIACDRLAAASGVSVGGHGQLPKKSPVLSVEKKASGDTGQSDKKSVVHKALKHLKNMTNDQLEALLESKDDFLIDCVLDHLPVIKKLQADRDCLQKQVNDLAIYNYAREPEFVRDRQKLRQTLDDVSALRRKVAMKHLQPILDKLNKAQNNISSEGRKYEEQSELLSSEFLNGDRSHEDFVEEYIKLRKETSRQRALADKLAQEREKLAENVTRPFESASPIPMPRQRKRVSFNN